jgi:hypothetical protein
MKTSVVKLFHPKSDRLVLYVKAGRTEHGVEIFWAHVDRKCDVRRWQRDWIDLKGGVFWAEIKKRGFDPEEVRMSISEWLDNDEGSPL